jgi:AcrR family transcriptional regulator
MQARSEETRARIVQAALKLFAANGYEATGVAEVCGAAEVSKGAFYHHFESKQAVFIELLQEWLLGLDKELGKAMTRSSSVPEGLMAMASEMRGVFAATDGRLPLFLEFWQQARRDPEVWRELIAPYRRYRDYFAAIIQKGIDEGSLPPQDPHAAAHTLVALAVGIVVQDALDPSGADWFRVTQDAIKLIISGLSNAKTGVLPGGR